MSASKGATRFGSIIDSATSVLVLVVAVLLCFSLVRSLFFSPPHQEAPRTAPVPGEVVTLPTLQANEGRTLILALSTNCQYCEASVPFYQRLAGLAREKQIDTRIVTSFREPIDVSGPYLQERGLQVPNIAVTPESFGVTAVPTALLIDHTGTILKVWQGQLPTPVEQELVDHLTELNSDAR